jgi:hypothetical protein
MLSANITSSFAATGIYPLDPEKIMNSDKLVHAKDLKSQNSLTNPSISSSMIDNIGQLSPRTRRHVVLAETQATNAAIQQQAENYMLQKRIDLLSTSKRKPRDKPNPNTEFQNSGGSKSVIGRLSRRKHVKISIQVARN